jgi:hypothetical protein
LIDAALAVRAKAAEGGISSGNAEWAKHFFVHGGKK